MAQPGQEITNPHSGQWMKFLVTASESGGERFAMESTVPAGAPREALHVHPRQESVHEVLSGRMGLRIGDRDLELGPGDGPAVIPAGAPHHFWVVGPEQARFTQEFRPALRIEDFFVAFFDLASRGRLGDDGMPNLLQSAVSVPAFADEIRLASPPWPLQRLFCAIVGPVARLRGYRPSYVND